MKCTGLYSGQIQPNAAKLIRQRNTVEIDNDTKHSVFSRQRSSIFFNSVILTEKSSFSVTEDETEDTKTQMKVATVKTEQANAVNPGLEHNGICLYP